MGKAPSGAKAGVFITPVKPGSSKDQKLEPISSMPKLHWLLPRVASSLVWSSRFGRDKMAATAPVISALRSLQEPWRRCLWLTQAMDTSRCAAVTTLVAASAVKSMSTTLLSGKGVEAQNIGPKPWETYHQAQRGRFLPAHFG